MIRALVDRVRNIKNAVVHNKEEGERKLPFLVIGDYSIKGVGAICIKTISKKLMFFRKK